MARTFGANGATSIFIGAKAFAGTAVPDTRIDDITGVFFSPATTDGSYVIYDVDTKGAVSAATRRFQMVAKYTLTNPTNSATEIKLWYSPVFGINNILNYNVATNNKAVPSAVKLTVNNSPAGVAGQTISYRLEFYDIQSVHNDDLKRVPPKPIEYLATTSDTNNTIAAAIAASAKAYTNVNGLQYLLNAYVFGPGDVIPAFLAPYTGTVAANEVVFIGYNTDVTGIDLGMVDGFVTRGATPDVITKATATTLVYGGYGTYPGAGDVNFVRGRERDYIGQKGSLNQVHLFPDARFYFSDLPIVDHTGAVTTGYDVITIQSRTTVIEPAMSTQSDRQYCEIYIPKGDLVALFDSNYGNAGGTGFFGEAGPLALYPKQIQSN
jgi:hypothetical protein